MAIGHEFDANVIGEPISKMNCAIGRRCDSVRQQRGNLREYFQCPICNKNFGHKQVFQLHLKVHDSNDQPNENEESRRTTDVANTSTNSLSNLPNKRITGLTKLRLEDCLRCDACSCIYLDECDYNKHMKNFHRQDSPKKQKSKKGCKSCCKQCNCQGNHQILPKERSNNNLFHYNIKDRWSKILSHRLVHNVKKEVKADPDEASATTDFSHLLSQVEVKIKTEPLDVPEFDESLQSVQ